MKTLIIWHHYNPLGTKIRGASSSKFNGSPDELVKLLRLPSEKKEKKDGIIVPHQVIIYSND